MKILFSIFVVWGFMWAGITIANGGEVWQIALHLFGGGINLIAINIT